jgi:hypothetical protein
VLFEDETDLLLCPPLRACWTKRGHDAPVLLSGSNARRVVFGTLPPRTGHRLLLDRPRQRAEDFCLLLPELHTHYRGWHVVLRLDEDSSHTAGASQQLAAELGIELFWLPQRCPELHPLDKLWGLAKQQVCANRQYLTMEELVERFLVYLHSLSPHEALQKAGVWSEHFWLKSVM